MQSSAIIKHEIVPTAESVKYALMIHDYIKFITKS